jgi:hypothetical protein
MPRVIFNSESDTHIVVVGAHDRLVDFAVVFISILSVVSFAVASFSCTTFQFQGYVDEDTTVQSFEFGFWKRAGVGSNCESYDIIDGWLKFGRIVGITGCQLGFASVAFFCLARFITYPKGTETTIGFSLLIASSLLSVCLLTGLQAEFCTTPGSSRLCRINLTSTGVFVFVSVVFNGFAGVILYWLEASRRPPVLTLPKASSNRVQPLNQPLESTPASSPSESEIVVETITEPDGSRTKRTTKRSVLSDGSKVVEETTEILERPHLTSNTLSEKLWSCMAVETVTKLDGSITTTTSKTFEEPDGDSVIQRTVEIREKKIRTITDILQSNPNLGRNGKSVEIDTIRRPDGSHTKTTTTTSFHKQFFVVERVIEIFERDVRTGAPPAASSVTQVSEPSLTNPEKVLISRDSSKTVGSEVEITFHKNDDDESVPLFSRGGVEESKDESESEESDDDVSLPVDAFKPNPNDQPPRPEFDEENVRRD